MDVDAFLNPPRPRDEVRRELGLADDEVAFGTVARLFELKGHDDILAVAPDVLAANPKVRFVFIGDGILRDRLIADARAAGHPRTPFIFTGLVPPDRIPELLGGGRRRGPPQPARGAGAGPAAGAAGRPAGDQLRRRRRPRGRPARDGHPAPAPRPRRASPPRSSGSPPTRPSATRWARRGGGGSPTSSATRR